MSFKQTEEGAGSYKVTGELSNSYLCTLLCSDYAPIEHLLPMSPLLAVHRTGMGRDRSVAAADFSVYPFKQAECCRAGARRRPWGYFLLALNNSPQTRGSKQGRCWQLASLTCLSGHQRARPRKPASSRLSWLCRKATASFKSVSGHLRAFSGLVFNS